MATDSGRLREACAPAHTGSGRDPSNTSYRVAKGGLLTGLRHGDPTHNALSVIPAWQRGLPAALWHGDHAHKYSRGIPAWRRGHLSTLWHGDPQQNHFWGRGTWQDCLEPVSNRSLADASAGLRHGIPGERPLGGIMAWRSSHLLALRP